jgi:outer membrane receptor protein involved in Fe transport
MNARSVWNLRALFALIAGASIIPAAVAQSAAPEEKKEEVVKLEKFEVTGSFIKRIDTEGPAPVTIITKDVMELSGSNTVQDVLRRIPSNFAGVNENVNNQGATGGAGNVSLRGLGVENTLLLINGRRNAPSAAAGGSSFVNINAIPLAAIDRIEVLQDGASALYGSDAIGGVVNVILRRDYTGSEMTVRYGNSFEEGDNHEFRANGIVGASTDKASALVVFDYFKRSSKLRQDFSGYTRTADLRALHGDGSDFRSPTGNPGTIILRPGSAYLAAGNPLGLPANPSGIFGIPDGSTGRWTSAAAFAATLLPGVERTFDFAGPNQIIPATKRQGIVGIATYKFNDKMEGFLEVSYNQNKTDVFLAATPVTATGAVNVVPANNPFNPFGESVNFRFRPLDVGPRTNFITTKNSRVLAGFKGEAFDNWNWELGFLTNTDSVSDIGVNYIVTADVISAASGTFARAPGLFLNVFGDKQGNDPRLLAALNNTVTTNGELKQESIDAKVTGVVMDLPAGELGVAIGAEARRERLQVFLDPLTQQGAFAGSGTRENTNGSRKVYSAYAEMSVPLVSPKQDIPFLRSAELQIAARKEEYYIRGKTYATFESTKPKYAISIRPTKDLLLRASYAEGFRAPSLFELFSGTNGSFPSVNDPLRSNTGHTLTNAAQIASLRYWVPSTPAGATSVALAGTGIAADDNQQVQQAQEGNTALTSEESESNYVGAVYNVPQVKGLTLSAGWFNIQHTGIIRLPSVTAQNIGVLNDPSLQFLVRRDPATPADVAAGRPGRLSTNGVAIFLKYVNRALVEVEGFDAEIEYEWKSAELGQFRHSLSGVYMAHFYDQTTAGQAIFDNVASGFTSYGTVPRVKMNLQNTWKRRNWTASAFVNWTGEYDDFSNRTGLERKVEPYMTVDLQGSYTFRTPWLGGNTTVTAGLINALDESAPFVTENITGSGNTAIDTQIVDPRGRFFYVQLRQSF